MKLSIMQAHIQLLNVAHPVISIYSERMVFLGIRVISLYRKSKELQKIAI
jgi:hypothetical protein